MGTSQHAPLVLRATCWLLLLLGVMALGGSTRWLGASFPGFFLMPNRVVPSAGLPGWAGAAEGRPLYHQVVLAVDAMPVARMEDAYARVARRTPGEPVEYALVSDGRALHRSLRVQRFGLVDYLGVFGAYFLTGCAYLALAFVALRGWRGDPRCRGLTAFACAGAAFSFTGMDLYGPGQLFRLHAVAEAFLAASAAHMALVCPNELFPRRHGLILFVYGLAAVLALVYEVFLYEPRAYTVVHNLCQGLVSLPILVLAARLSMEVGEIQSWGESRASVVLLGGTLIGLVAPALVFGISTLAGGGVPVSAAAWINFVFPLACVASLRHVPRTALVGAPAI